MSSKPGEALLRTVDSLIQQHGSHDPQLSRDLRALRAELEAVLRRRQYGDIAFIALRIATWIKFIYDHLPPPPLT